MFYPLDYGPFPRNYWANFKSELNFDYYNHVTIYFIPYFLFYHVTPKLIPLYIRKFKNDPTKINAFCVDLGSTIASLFATSYACLSLFIYLPRDNQDGMQFCFRKANALLCAYLLADTIFRLLQLRSKTYIKLPNYFSPKL